MKRLLGLVALLLVPALLTMPTAGAVESSRTSASVSAKVTVTDIAARARRIVGLANSYSRPGHVAELATLATPATASFLTGVRRDRDGWLRATPTCRRSTASSPGATVYACRIAEQPAGIVLSSGKKIVTADQWWLYFRKVEGRWTAVNKRLASSATTYRKARNLEARTEKIMDLAWQENWDAVAPYLSSSLLVRLRSSVASVKADDGPGGPGTAFTEMPTWGHCAKISAPYAAAYGSYGCGWLVESYGDSISWVSYRQIDGHWIAVRTFPVPECC